MICAQEAFYLYEQTGAVLKKFLEQEVEPKIKDAASRGQRKIFVDLGSCETWSNLAIDFVHKAAIKELSSLGYTVSFGKNGHPFVPRGLADDHGEGPTYINYGLHIAW